MVYNFDFQNGCPSFQLFVKSLISAILWILSGLAAEPTLEDNRLPLDEEYDTLWHKVGQPEMQPVPGGDQSFNAFYSGGGNDHFVSAIFPGRYRYMFFV